MRAIKLHIALVQFVFFTLLGCGTISAQTESRFLAETCPEKNVELKDQILQARLCQSDSDCSPNERILSCHFTPCYGYPVNQTADLKALEAQLMEYEASCAEPLMCACPPKEEIPQCLSGVCGYAGF